MIRIHRAIERYCQACGANGDMVIEIGPSDIGKPGWNCSYSIALCWVCIAEIVSELQ